MTTCLALASQSRSPLAPSAQYLNQACRVSKRAYGFQFHVEINDIRWRGWLPYLPPEIGANETQSLRIEIEHTGNHLLARVIKHAAG